MSIHVTRFMNQPLVTPETDASIGGNINGPSLIKVPSWLPNPLGAYYLYFAHHSGKFIRMAYADRLEGPWTVYEPGTLQREQSYCRGHIASPDVHLDEANRRLVMFYHGVPQQPPGHVPQVTKLAVSDDGLHFTASEETLGRAYWRCFMWEGAYYAVTMAGPIYRSSNLYGPYEEGPDLFRETNIWRRHLAVKRIGSTLYVFYSIKGDTPEHIVVSRVSLRDDWRNWSVREYESVLKPELDFEGADLPLERSESGAIHQRVRQLRDPGIYEEAGRTYLLYSIAGENGLAMVELAFAEEDGQHQPERGD